MTTLIDNSSPQHVLIKESTPSSGQRSKIRRETRAAAHKKGETGANAKGSQKGGNEAPNRSGNSISTLRVVPVSSSKSNSQAGGSPADGALTRTASEAAIVNSRHSDDSRDDVPPWPPEQTPTSTSAAEMFTMSNEQHSDDSRDGARPWAAADPTFRAKAGEEPSGDSIQAMSERQAHSGVLAAMDPIRQPSLQPTPDPAISSEMPTNLMAFSSPDGKTLDRGESGGPSSSTFFNQQPTFFVAMAVGVVVVAVVIGMLLATRVCLAHYRRRKGALHRAKSAAPRMEAPKDMRRIISPNASGGSRACSSRSRPAEQDEDDVLEVQSLSDVTPMSSGIESEEDSSTDEETSTVGGVGVTYYESGPYRPPPQCLVAFGRDDFTATSALTLNQGGSLSRI